MLLQGCCEVAALQGRGGNDERKNAVVQPADRETAVPVGLDETVFDYVSCLIDSSL